MSGTEGFRHGDSRDEELAESAPQQMVSDHRYGHSAQVNGTSQHRLLTVGSSRGSRFGGLAATVEASIASSIEKNLGNYKAPYNITAADLSRLSNERTRQALADLLEKGVSSNSPSEDQEAPSSTDKLRSDVLKLVDRMRGAEKEGHHAFSEGEVEADKNADMAANVVATVLLRSSPETGIDPREVEHRRNVFGTNGIQERKLDSFLKLCWEAVQDFVLLLLIVLGIISIVVETVVGQPNGEKCSTCWIQGFAILVSVGIVVLVTAGIDYAKQFAFIRLTNNLHNTNTKAVIRDGKQVSVIDDDIVVGDILSVNSHSLASIPADCVLLGPASDLKMDESSLTGESKMINKKPGDVILSGTTAVQGSGKMVVIAVGLYSVAGKIKARVYEAEDHDDEWTGNEENSPLFVKLDLIAKQIGIAGTFAAVIAFLASCIIGLAIRHEKASNIVNYLIVSITVLAVAVPEGLPLAVTLALAFSSNQMMREQNLVKHLDACETMGCATTICTDKTGTLTANKMTVRALFTALKNYICDDPAVTFGDYVITEGASPQIIDLICRTVAIDTMNETVLYYDRDGKLDVASGNPTEIALLVLVNDLGEDYEQIRNTTRGRSDVGQLGEFLSEGTQYGFSSARKMMSWAVPLENGGYRLYCKGAQEVIIGRCSKYAAEDGSAVPLGEKSRDEFATTADAYGRRGMRCIGLAYRDLPPGFDFETLSTTARNPDGTPAYEAETDLVAIALVGIEDPLRPEVPDAIRKCYEAGIDVRLVTGDNPNTAVSIAYQAGILRDDHFVEGTVERVAINLKANVLMEGRDFRGKVYREVKNGVPEFDQAAFDKIWPHLRVLARSSPDDKLTLAHGLNQSTLFADKIACRKLYQEHRITIFPDRQVVAMTGDGTNDAPALKRADIGFAMGISGTQIAKDAADIILLDDNFASIVTAAKWGRNVYASIQKFLQFQLTVNVGAVVTALVGAFYRQVSPLAAIQLLWVNLLMDSLASLALASEPPVEELLTRPPVNRTEHMITPRMWANISGQAIFQITATMVLLFAGPKWFNLERGDKVEQLTGKFSVHYTIIFNAFVWMQFFNEINCRHLRGEWNVFSGVLKNKLFCAILLTTIILQILIVEFGTVAFHVAEGGLSGKYWAISVGIGALSLPVQQVINLFFWIGQKYHTWRINRRRAKNYALSVRVADGSHVHRE